MTTIGSKYRNTKEYHLLYCKLIEAAQNSSELTYTAVAAIIGIHVPGNHMAREVGQILGEISEDEHAAGRPMLSAVAVRNSGRPGDGFFELARRLGKLTGTTQDLDFWMAEKDKVYKLWRNT